jgi:hypothetical protein
MRKDERVEGVRYYPDFNKLYVVRWYDLARLCRDTTVTFISRPAASVVRYIANI